MAGRPKGQPKTGGRKKGAVNKATADIKALAAKYAPDALKELARLSREAVSESARVAASGMILDRAYGKPAQSLTGPDGGPIQIATKAQRDAAVRAGRRADT